MIIFGDHNPAYHLPMSIVIQVSQLTKTFRSPVRAEGLSGALRSLIHREYKEYTAAHDISFSIERGELVGMLGSNGAGKTTTLKMLSGLLRPSSGTASVMGYIPWERKNGFRRSFALVMGQRNQLWWDLPAADSFLLNKEIYRIPESDYRRRVKELSEKLDVADKLHIQVRRLSLGERMKCELIGALLHEPAVIYLDEPTIGLDVVAQHSLREFVAEFNARHQTTIILTSHYMDDIKALCRRVLLVDQGRLVYDGALEGLTNQYADEKLLRIAFMQQPPALEALQKVGRVDEYTHEHAVICIPRTSVAAIASHLLQNFQIQDITIQDIPVEEIIRTIFSRQTAQQINNANAKH
jgi:ABC-2 type transport system ATP-binding protein